MKRLTTYRRCRCRESSTSATGQHLPCRHHLLGFHEPPSFTKTINASRDGTVASTNQDAEQVVAEQRAAGAGGRLTTFYELPTRAPSDLKPSSNV